MKLSEKISLLISMLFIGIVCGSSFYILTVTLESNNIIHCLFMGVVFGFINYLISYGIFKKYILLRETNELLKQDIKVDKLTGLFNRRAFDDDLEHISGCDLYSMIFIDIDNFRNFNNEFGHQAGDDILRKVSLTILASVAQSGRVYRYGGEEIVVVLTGFSKKDAFELAEKTRISIEQLDNSPYPGISISLGISSFPDDGTEIVEIIKACDNALLTAKNLGKNRTITYSK